jgi:hypothetical protein
MVISVFVTRGVIPSCCIIVGVTSEHNPYLCCCNVGIQVPRLEPQTREINVKMGNVKVCGFQSKSSESSNKCFHLVPWGNPRGLFIEPLGGWFTLSK